MNSRLNLRPLVAHRGESHLAPENTMAAIEHAWSLGDWAVELDVRLTRDDRLVVCHDADTTRTTGQPLVIREHSVDRLCQLDAGGWKGRQWAGERLPTLEQALASVPADGRLFIEVKDDVEAVPVLTRAITRSAIASEQCVVISFHTSVLAALKQAIPSIETYWLTAPASEDARPEAQGSGQTAELYDARHLIRTAKAIDTDGVDLKAAPCITADLVVALHEAGLSVCVWTVDEPAQAQAMFAAGVDSLTTNRAAWMAKQLDDIAGDFDDDARERDHLHVEKLRKGGE